MTNLRTAAQQALEALECVDLQSLVPDYGSGHYSVARLDGPNIKAAITALRAALAEPVQEPVAYSEGRTLHWHQGKGVSNTQLYLAPLQRKPLTEEEIYSLFRTAGSPTAFARAIERAHGIT